MDYTSFDWETYNLYYPDLKSYNITSKNIAWKHWNLHGKYENRKYFNINDYISFDWETYVNKYEYIKLLNFNNKKDAWNHYILYELSNEKNYNSEIFYDQTLHKSTIFIPEIYKFLNPDLINLNRICLIKHYNLCGLAENRKYTITDFIYKTNFDYKIYNQLYNLNLNLQNSIIHLLSNIKNAIYPHIFFYNKYPNFNIKIYKVFNNLEIENEFDILNMFHNNKNKNIIYSLKTFYQHYPKFNYIIYRKINNINNITEVDTIINWFLNDKTYDFLNNININDYNRKKIIIYPHQYYDYSNGGIVVQYNLAYNIDLLGEQVRIYDSFNRYQSDFNVNYFNNDFIIDNNVMVIYCEGVNNNPLNAPNVTRWILSKLGINVPIDTYTKWNSNDLIYYFNYEMELYNNFINNKDIYKTLSILYLNPNIQNFNIDNRNGYCHTLRKNNIHKYINYIHPENSYEITRQNTQNEYTDIFNNYEYFISYDPLTFLSIIAALCGCISIVYPIDNVTKKEWYKSTAVIKYMNEQHIEDLYGIAYGNSEEEINYAKSTIHLVKNQWNDILNYYKNDISNYIIDINNDSNKNNVKNIFIN